MLSVRPVVWVGPGGPGSGCVRKGIRAQDSLYIWGRAEWRAGYPHLGFLGSPGGNVFLLQGRQSAAL